MSSTGTLTKLDVPSAFGTELLGVNNAGQIIGVYFPSLRSADFQMHYFVEENGVFTPLDLPGATSAQLFGINDAGDIAGEFSDSTGTHGFLATPVAAPEPISFLLVLTGLVTVGIDQRSRQEASA